MKKCWLIVAVACYLMLCSCAKEDSVAPQSESTADSGTNVQIANPIRPVESADEFNTLKITLQVPNDAEDVGYSIIGEDTADVEFCLQDAAYTLRASRAFPWQTLAGVYEEMTETNTTIVAVNNPHSKMVGEIYTVANGGLIGTWQWGDVVFTLYTQDDVNMEAFSALCNTLAGETAVNETA